ncbi:MAG: phosphatase PAP2 family protein [Rhodothermaceae bacterium]|nr:MAG: phosphatase PAP2 family protein [Rhodothermaceae bacterium]
MFLLLILLPALPLAAPAQPGGTPSLDVRLLRQLYRADLPGLDTYLYAVDATAYPVFFGGPGLAWGYAFAAGDRHDRAAAYRLSVSVLATTASVLAIKHLVRRPRPYAVLPDVRARVGTHRRYPEPVRDPYAFPSGHAALAFAVAVSWSLSHPRAYVVAPGLIWAASVSLSRVRFGVHYPSDVLAGAALGTGLAVLLHLARDTLAPPGLRASKAPPPLYLRIGF